MYDSYAKRSTSANNKRQNDQISPTKIDIKSNKILIQKQLQIQKNSTIEQSFAQLQNSIDLREQQPKCKMVGKRYQSAFPKDFFHQSKNTDLTCNTEENSNYLINNSQTIDVQRQSKRKNDHMSCSSNKNKQQKNQITIQDRQDRLSTPVTSFQSKYIQTNSQKQNAQDAQDAKDAYNAWECLQKNQLDSGEFLHKNIYSLDIKCQEQQNRPISGNCKTYANNILNLQRNIQSERKERNIQSERKERNLSSEGKERIITPERKQKIITPFSIDQDDLKNNNDFKTIQQQTNQLPSVFKINFPKIKQRFNQYIINSAPKKQPVDLRNKDIILQRIKDNSVNKIQKYEIQSAILERRSNHKLFQDDIDKNNQQNLLNIQLDMFTFSFNGQQILKKLGQEQTKIQIKQEKNIIKLGQEQTKMRKQEKNRKNIKLRSISQQK